MSLSSPSLLYDYCKIEELVLSASQKILEQVRKRKEWHPLLQDRIANIGKELGLKVQKEYILRNFSENRVGILDVVWISNGTPIVAFEIDAAAGENRSLSFWRLKQTCDFGYITVI